MRKGVRARTRRTASRNMSICVTNRSKRGSRRFTIKKGSARNPIAAIIRHPGIMPELSERRNALRFSALRLLTDHQKREAIRRRDLDGEPVREIARSHNVSYSTISRLQSAGINLERSSIWIC